MRRVEQILANKGKGIEITLNRMGEGYVIIGKELKKRLSSDNPLFYNPELKRISGSCREIWNYCVDKSRDNNKELRRLNSATKAIYIFPRLGGLFLEKIKGYQRI